jgi:hypothetical protein
VIGPEDAPLLRAAAGVITTGGGILSHAGLIALEMGKPSLLLRGRWLHEAPAAQSLRLRRTEYRERRERVGRFDVACWELVREREEYLREGDLIAIDADEGVVRLLGQDRVALALHHGLEDLGLAARRLAGAATDAQVMELRGRLLRALHGLRKLLRELDAPWLAHHAVRQLLSAEADATATPASAERRELLQILFDNPHVGTAAAAAAAAATGESVARLTALEEQARCTIPVLTRPLEIVFLRHTLVRLAAGLHATRRIHTLDTAAEALLEAAADIDRQVAARLATLRDLLGQQADRWRHDPANAWRVRHLLPQLDTIDRVLDQPHRAGIDRLPAAPGSVARDDVADSFRRT